MILNELLTKRDAFKAYNTWGGIFPEAENTIGKQKSLYTHVAGPSSSIILAFPTAFLNIQKTKARIFCQIVWKEPLIWFLSYKR